MPAPAHPGLPGAERPDAQVSCKLHAIAARGENRPPRGKGRRGHKEIVAHSVKEKRRIGILTKAQGMMHNKEEEKCFGCKDRKPQSVMGHYQ